MEYLVCKKKNELFIMTRKQREEMLVAKIVINQQPDSFVVRVFDTIQDASIFIKKQKIADKILKEIFL